MTKSEAERLLNKYLKRYDKSYKDIIEIISYETKIGFGFVCKYKNVEKPVLYSVLKSTKDVVLAPT